MIVSIRNIAIYIDRERRSIIWFWTIGIMTFILQYISYRILVSLCVFNYRISVSVSYIVAVAFHFFMNRNLTFQSRNGNVYSELLRYVSMVCINCLITITVVEITVRQLLLSPDIGLVLSMAVTVVSGYLLSRLWVFRDARI